MNLPANKLVFVGGSLQVLLTIGATIPLMLLFDGNLNHAILAGFLSLGGIRLMLRSRAGGAFYDSLAATPDPCACDAPEDAAESAGEREPAVPAWMRSEPLRGALTVALCGAYVFLLMGRLPYIPATFLFLAGFILVFRGAGLPRSGVIGAAASVSIWFVFYKIFAVFLP